MNYAHSFTVTYYICSQAQRFIYRRVIGDTLGSVLVLCISMCLQSGADLKGGLRGLQPPYCPKLHGAPPQPP